MATTTSNFGLNITEGSDIVNPLIYDNPNYNMIDAQMFKNQNSALQKANYSKAGTVHQIVRIVPTANAFYFIASSNFKVGDTFTVDGGAVTATLPNGEGLQNNAFVINANVICVLNGSALTVFAGQTLPDSMKFAETAGKLKTPVNIGNARFDGSTSITLNEMGVKFGVVAVTPGTSYGSYGSRISVSNNYVDAIINLTKASNVATNDLICTLPANARPQFSFDCVCILRNPLVGGVECGLARFNIDGTVVYSAPTPSTSGLTQVIIKCGYPLA